MMYEQPYLDNGRDLITTHALQLAVAHTVAVHEQATRGLPVVLLVPVGTQTLGVKTAVSKQECAKCTCT